MRLLGGRQVVCPWIRHARTHIQHPYTHTHIHRYTQSTHPHSCPSKCTHTSTHTHTHTHTCTYPLHTHRFTPTPQQIHIHTYTHTHAPLYTSTHTHRWKAGGVPLDQFGVTSVKDEPGWKFPNIADFTNGDPHCLAWFHRFMQVHTLTLTHSLTHAGGTDFLSTPRV